MTLLIVRVENISSVIHILSKTYIVIIILSYDWNKLLRPISIKLLCMKNVYI